ncbi:ephrin-A4 isoform X3 [Panthera pardus]|uniref:Ephrin-A4 n=1 Tax=Panthera pardus TaxID=9691 RepID=A0A9W2W1T4_PANPR|nr:ephrin-A4 isoform X3 [Panthera pardus]
MRMLIRASLSEAMTVLRTPPSVPSCAAAPDLAFVKYRVLCQTLCWALGPQSWAAAPTRKCRAWLLGGDAVVELVLNDYLDIFCPHYDGPGPPDGPETFALYMVDRQGYEACQAQGPGAFKRWECALPFAPFGPVRFSEKIQRFTPFSLGFEFLPGETYYYISVPAPESSGRCLKLQVSVCCKESKSESAHPVGSPGESGTSGWQGGGPPSPLCLLLLLLPILRLLRIL